MRWDLLLPLVGWIFYSPSLPYEVGSSTPLFPLGWDVLFSLPPLWVGSSTSPPSLVGWDLLLTLPPLWGRVFYFPTLPCWMGSFTSPPLLPPLRVGIFCFLSLPVGWDFLLLPPLWGGVHRFTPNDFSSHSSNITTDVVL